MPYQSFAATNVAAGTATVEAAIPSGVQVGDLLLAMAWAGAGNTTATWSSPGWTVTTNANGISAMWRVADGTEGASDTFTRTVTTGTAGVIIKRYSGMGTVQTASVAFDGGAISTSLALPSVNTAQANSVLVQAVTKLPTGAGPWGPPAGTTERFDAVSGGSSTTQVAGGDETFAGTGATGTRTWTREATDAGASKGVIWVINPPAVPKVGSATGSWNVVGTASGVRRPTGSGQTASWNVIGSAEGKRTPKGAADPAGYEYSGSAFGSHAVSGDSVGTWAATGTASGRRVQQGGGEPGSWDAFGSAIGFRLSIGSATGLMLTSGSASGIRASLGSAVGNFSTGGTAKGPVVPFETMMNRLNTKEFIDADPVDIILIPQKLVRSHTGTKMEPQEPRPVQRFRLIPTTDIMPEVQTPDGIQTVSTYVLMGEYNSQMDRWDMFFYKGRHMQITSAIRPIHTDQRYFLKGDVAVL